MPKDALKRLIGRILWRLGLSGPTAAGEPDYVLSQDGYKEYRFSTGRFAREFLEPVVRIGPAEKSALAQVREGERAESLWLEATKVDEGSAFGCQRLLRLVYAGKALLVDVFEQHEHPAKGGDYRTRMFVSGTEAFFCETLYECLSNGTLVSSGHGPRVACRASREAPCGDGRHLVRVELELDVDLERGRADLRVKETSHPAK